MRLSRRHRKNLPMKPSVHTRPEPVKSTFMAVIQTTGANAPATPRCTEGSTPWSVRLVQM